MSMGPRPPARSTLPGAGEVRQEAADSWREEAYRHERIRTKVIDSYNRPGSTSSASEKDCSVPSR